MALVQYCADKCPCPGMVPEYYLRRDFLYPGTVLKLWAPLKYYVHIGARAQAPNPRTKSGRGLSLDRTHHRPSVTKRFDMLNSYELCLNPVSIEF